jgi:DNA polymerase-3 subunit epsilon
LKNHFFVYDVETANRNRDSLCEIAIIEVVNNKIHSGWQTHVNPETHFDSFNTRLHRINEQTVKFAPKIPDVIDQIKERFENQIVVSHTSFDQQVIRACLSRFEKPKFNYKWADSSEIIRAVWPDKYSTKGYNLPNLAKDFNLSYDAHYAIDDARVAAIIMCHALETSNYSIEQWAEGFDTYEDFEGQKVLGNRYRAPGEIQYPFDQKIEVPDAKGQIVFTGELSVTREEATEMAVKAGYSVALNVTRKTTHLVAGAQNKDLLCGHEISTKQRKAEELIEKGRTIIILDESGFLSLIDQ